MKNQYFTPKTTPQQKDGFTTIISYAFNRKVPSNIEQRRAEIQS